MDYVTLIRQLWDRGLAWMAIGIGGLVLLLGWLGASREVLATAQIPYVISGGLGGLFLLGIGAVLWISADLRDEWRQLHEIATRLGAGENGDRPHAAASPRPITSEELVTAAGTTVERPQRRGLRRTISPSREDQDEFGRPRYDQEVLEPADEEDHRAFEPPNEDREAVEPEVAQKERSTRPLRARRTPTGG
jgi:hypothetical protein